MYFKSEAIHASPLAILLKIFFACDKIVWDSFSGIFDLFSDIIDSTSESKLCNWLITDWSSCVLSVFKK